MITQFFSESIEQLDLTLDQLALNDRNYDRFALMLIDNVVELTLHKYAQQFAHNSFFMKKIYKKDFDPNDVQKALGQYFDEKVKFANKTGLINKQICESILCLHAFRNTSHHRGLRHERILHSLTIFYFRNVCRLLKSFDPILWYRSSDEIISYRARKYVGNFSHGELKDVKISAFDRLNHVADNLEWQLTKDLSNDMKNIIEDINYDLDFLTENTHEILSRKDAIIDSQARDFVFTKKEKIFSLQKEMKMNSINELIAWLKINYNWKYKKDPIPSWWRRHKSLFDEKDLHKALKKYCDFMKQTENIRNVISESAEGLDAYIQHQTDLIRGK